MDALDLSLEREHTLLLVVDMQERLAAAMDPGAFGRVLANAQILLQGAARLGLPVLATEQYPRGLGPTVGPIRERLDALSVKPIEKVEFSCARAPGFTDALESLTEQDTIVLVGMEAHVCVYQTALDLLARGLRVHIPADAALLNWAASLLALPGLATKMLRTMIMVSSR